MADRQELRETRRQQVEQYLSSGMTIAVCTWAARANPNTSKICYICMSTVANMEFYRMLCSQLGLEQSFKKSDVFADIQARIRSLVDEKRMRVTVVLDEAQCLSSAILRDLQMLTNFDMDSRDMFALVLVGYPQLAQVLARQPYEPLRQRLGVSYRMEALDGAQAASYVRDRFLRAGRTRTFSTPRRCRARSAAAGAQCGAWTPSWSTR